MSFTHYDLGQRSRGDIVEVAFSGNAAHVRLMDDSNFSNYRNGRRYRFLGGLARRSLIRLQVNNPGHWHVAVDLSGLGGSTKSTIRVIPA